IGRDGIRVELARQREQRLQEGEPGSQPIDIAADLHVPVARHREDVVEAPRRDRPPELPPRLLRRGERDMGTTHVEGALRDRRDPARLDAQEPGRLVDPDAEVEGEVATEPGERGPALGRRAPSLEPFLAEHASPPRGGRLAPRRPIVLQGHGRAQRGVGNAGLHRRRRRARLGASRGDASRTIPVPRACPTDPSSWPSSATRISVRAAPRRAIGRLEQAPDAVVMTGDLADGGHDEAYALLRELLAPLSMPVYLLVGNHDAREPLLRAFPDHARLASGAPAGSLQYEAT